MISAMPVNLRLSSLLTSDQISRVTIVRPNPEVLAVAADPAAVVAARAAAVAVLIDDAPAGVVVRVERPEADRQSNP
jgi:hypothetical protein